MPTDDAENTHGINLGLINKLRNLPRGTERMPQENQRLRKTTIYRSIHPQQE